MVLQAKLERGRIPVQIDIGFGDVVTPAPQQVEYPSMLGFPTPVVSTYPRETVVAEKFQAMVMLPPSPSFSSSSPPPHLRRPPHPPRKKGPPPLLFPSS